MRALAALLLALARPAATACPPKPGHVLIRVDRSEAPFDIEHSILAHELEGAPSPVCLYRRLSTAPSPGGTSCPPGQQCGFQTSEDDLAAAGLEAPALRNLACSKDSRFPCIPSPCAILTMSYFRDPLSVTKSADVDIKDTTAVYTSLGIQTHRSFAPSTDGSTLDVTGYSTCDPHFGTALFNYTGSLSTYKEERPTSPRAHPFFSRTSTQKCRTPECFENWPSKLVAPPVLQKHPWALDQMPPNPVYFYSTEGASDDQKTRFLAFFGDPSYADKAYPPPGVAPHQCSSSTLKKRPPMVAVVPCMPLANDPLYNELFDGRAEKNTCRCTHASTPYFEAVHVRAPTENDKTDGNNELQRLTTCLAASGRYRSRLLADRAFSDAENHYNHNMVYSFEPLDHPQPTNGHPTRVVCADSSENNPHDREAAADLDGSGRIPLYNCNVDQDLHPRLFVGAMSSTYQTDHAGVVVFPQFRGSDGEPVPGAFSRFGQLVGIVPSPQMMLERSREARSKDDRQEYYMNSECRNLTTPTLCQQACAYIDYAKLGIDDLDNVCVHRFPIDLFTDKNIKTLFSGLFGSTVSYTTPAEAKIATYHSDACHIFHTAVGARDGGCSWLPPHEHPSICLDARARRQADVLLPPHQSRYSLTGTSDLLIDFSGFHCTNFHTTTFHNAYTSTSTQHAGPLECQRARSMGHQRGGAVQSKLRPSNKFPIDGEYNPDAKFSNFYSTLNFGNTIFRFSPPRDCPQDDTVCRISHALDNNMVFPSALPVVFDKNSIPERIRAGLTLKTNTISKSLDTRSTVSDDEFNQRLNSRNSPNNRFRQCRIRSFNSDGTVTPDAGCEPPSLRDYIRNHCKHTPDRPQTNFKSYSFKTTIGYDRRAVHCDSKGLDRSPAEETRDIVRALMGTSNRGHLFSSSVSEDPPQASQRMFCPSSACANTSYEAYYQPQYVLDKMYGKDNTNDKYSTEQYPWGNLNPDISTGTAMLPGACVCCAFGGFGDLPYRLARTDYDDDTKDILDPPRWATPYSYGVKDDDPNRHSASGWCSQEPVAEFSRYNPAGSTKIAVRSFQKQDAKISDEAEATIQHNDRCSLWTSPDGLAAKKISRTKDKDFLISTELNSEPFPPLDVCFFKAQGITKEKINKFGTVEGVTLLKEKARFEAMIFDFYFRTGDPNMRYDNFRALIQGVINNLDFKSQVQRRQLHKDPAWRRAIIGVSLYHQNNKYFGVPACDKSHELDFLVDNNLDFIEETSALSKSLQNTINILVPDSIYRVNPKDLRLFRFFFDTGQAVRAGNVTGVGISKEEFLNFEMVPDGYNYDTDRNTDSFKNQDWHIVNQCSPFDLFGSFRHNWQNYQSNGGCQIIKYIQEDKPTFLQGFETGLVFGIHNFESTEKDYYQDKEPGVAYNLQGKTADGKHQIYKLCSETNPSGEACPRHWQRRASTCFCNHWWRSGFYQGGLIVTDFSYRVGDPNGQFSDSNQKWAVHREDHDRNKEFGPLDVDALVDPTIYWHNNHSALDLLNQRRPLGADTLLDEAVFSGELQLSTLTDTLSVCNITGNLFSELSANLECFQVNPYSEDQKDERTGQDASWINPAHFFGPRVATFGFNPVLPAKNFEIPFNIYSNLNRLTDQKQSEPSTFAFSYLDPTVATTNLQLEANVVHTFQPIVPYSGTSFSTFQSFTSSPHPGKACDCQNRSPVFLCNAVLLSSLSPDRQKTLAAGILDPLPGGGYSDEGVAVTSCGYYWSNDPSGKRGLQMFGSESPFRMVNTHTFTNDNAASRTLGVLFGLHGRHNISCADDLGEFSNESWYNSCCQPGGATDTDITSLITCLKQHGDKTALGAAKKIATIKHQEAHPEDLLAPLLFSGPRPGDVVHKFPNTCLRYPFGQAHFLSMDNESRARIVDSKIINKIKRPHSEGMTYEYSDATILTYCEKVPFADSGGSTYTDRWVHCENDALTADARAKFCTSNPLADKVIYSLVVDSPPLANTCNGNVCLYVPGTSGAPTLRSYIERSRLDFTNKTILVAPFTTRSISFGFYSTVFVEENGQLEPPQCGDSTCRPPGIENPELFRELIKISPSTTADDLARYVTKFHSDLCPQKKQGRCLRVAEPSAQALAGLDATSLEKYVDADEVVPPIKEAGIVLGQPGMHVRSAVNGDDGVLRFAALDKRAITHTRFIIKAPNVRVGPMFADQDGCEAGYRCAAALVAGPSAQGATLDRVSTSGTEVPVMVLGRTEHTGDRPTDNLVSADGASINVGACTDCERAVAAAAATGTIFVGCDEPSAPFCSVIAQYDTPADQPELEFITGSNQTVRVLNLSDLTQNFGVNEEKKIFSRPVDHTGLTGAAFAVIVAATALLGLLHAALYLEAVPVAVWLVSKRAKIRSVSTPSFTCEYNVKAGEHLISGPGLDTRPALLYIARVVCGVDGGCAGLPPELVAYCWQSVSVSLQ